MNEYLKDIEEWENSFYCNCGEGIFENFNYKRSASSGEIWDCTECDFECLVSSQPNEDDYLK